MRFLGANRGIGSSLIHVNITIEQSRIIIEPTESYSELIFCTITGNMFIWQPSGNEPSISLSILEVMSCKSSIWLSGCEGLDAVGCEEGKVNCLVRRRDCSGGL